MSKSTRASGSRASTPCAGSSAITSGRLICKFARFHRKASPTIPAPRNCWCKPASKGPTSSAAAHIPTPIPSRRSPASSTSRAASISTSTFIWISTSIHRGCTSMRSAGKTDAQGWGGRVAVGHVTKLSAIDHSRLAEIGRRLADAGVAVTVLPATDLFLMGRDRQLHVPRGVAPAHRLLLDGVTCSLATNNVLNPFTPFGDCSLIRIANLYANVAQIGGARDLKACFDMITTLPPRLMNAAHYGVAVGHPADLVVVDSRDPALAVAEVAQPLFGLKRGRRSFTRAAATIHRP